VKEVCGRENVPCYWFPKLHGGVWLGLWPFVALSKMIARRQPGFRERKGTQGLKNRGGGVRTPTEEVYRESN